jgi:small GTP-binding protein
MTFNFDSTASAANEVPSGSPERATPSGSGPRPIPGPPESKGESPARRRALLVGNPNVGKSVLFGKLTGTYVTVSNYPGTTVEVTRGRVHQPGHEAWELLDTPGTNNLVPMSEDEAVTRDILLSEPSDVLVQVGDAKNLARTLLLTLQLAELGVPFLVDLNMIDEARARGIAIDTEALARELAGVRVHTSAAVSGEGVDGVRGYLAERGRVDVDGSRSPLACAPTFADDVEEAIAAVAGALPAMPVAKRAIATMLLAGDRGFGGWVAQHAGDAARAVAKERAERLAKAHGVPTFALLSKARLARAQAIVRAVQRKDDAHQGARAREGNAPWPRAIALGLAGGAITAATYDGALARLATGAPASDPLDDYGFFDVCARLLTRDVARAWSLPSLGLFALVAVLGAVVARRHAQARAAAWKLVASFAVGYGAYWLSSSIEGLALHRWTALPVHLGVLAGLATLAAWSASGDRRDALVSRFLGRYATHPTWGLPILAVVLFFAYKVVGVFGAGTAVDFLENRVFGDAQAATPSLNHWAYAFFAWMNVPFLTAFFVGPYGIITMGVTYAVAIVLPVVATFFFVFSMLEDSGYLPRLAVMANRQLRVIGLNGKAVLPMVLGLGCDTMATLTARIMETKKERVLVTLLLALGIPCSSQLSVIFAMMQRTSTTATLVWLAVVAFTILFVGWVAAKVVPGDKSDFLLEMPPIRRPQVGNLVAKTMARIEWYLKEAVPLFLAGTALLFFLDRFKLLGWIHRAGEPVVHHLLGFQREGGVSDRVSEAMLVGFLRRDFGAAGLLDMTRSGHLSTADVAVSMIVITLFIPCIANVFIIFKERGWKVGTAMCAFIFPYAVAVGGLVRLLFTAFGGAS